MKFLQLVPHGFKLDKNRFDEEPDNLEEISKSLMKLKLSTFRRSEKCLCRELSNLRFKLKQKLSEENFQILLNKINKTMNIRKHSNKLKKLKKFMKLKMEKGSNKDFESEGLLGEFFLSLQV